MLSHYDAVVWDTGDDYLTRLPGQPAAPAGAARDREQLAVRDYLNEGGKLFYTGQSAGQQYAEGYEFRNFGFPEPRRGGRRPRCPGRPRRPEAVDGCIPPNNDFLQYYLGAYIYVGAGNTTTTAGHPYPIRGEGDPFDGLRGCSTTTARGQPGAHGDVRGDQLDPAAGRSTRMFADSPASPTGLRPGAGAVQTPTAAT